MKSTKFLIVLFTEFPSSTTILVDFDDKFTTEYWPVLPLFERRDRSYVEITRSNTTYVAFFL